MCHTFTFKILEVTPHIFDSIVVCPRERVAFVFSASGEDNTQKKNAIIRLVFIFF